MLEKIGRVTLDDTWYPGEDLYSDGPVEDELLQIARTVPEDELNREITARKSWPVLYHFSHIRQNILEWIPMKKTDRVLEIGAGCGAVTSALAKKAGQVTCIDLSQKRSRMNAYRNRDFENVRILMGNFQDIEKNLTERYDVITLIGVFEYSQGYIGTKEPYAEMLRRVSRHLAEGGQLVIAIENRLGLKYWAGCTEDHLGTFFEGLEGYPRPTGVRTFSKRELEKEIRKAGDFAITWYYPYPDYKFPMKVFSDARLPQKGELTENFLNYDRRRVQLFQEPAVYDTLIESGLFPEFSNSFLVIVEKQSKKPEKGKQILYTKYSNERSRQFALRTDIVSSAGERYVEKTAFYPEGFGHVESLREKEKLLAAVCQKTGWSCNACLKKEEDATPGGVRLEYLEGSTLEEQLDTLLLQDETEEAKKLLIQFLMALQASHQDREFAVTDEFVRVFGEIPGLCGSLSGEVTDVDLLCQNLMTKKDGRQVVLDYEWTFSFPIPCHFLLYRVIHYYLDTNPIRTKLSSAEFYEMFGISEDERGIYEKMEGSFQRYMAGGMTPMRELYSDMTPGLCPARELGKGRLQVFYEREGGYRPECSCTIPLDNWYLDAELPVPAGCRTIRLDPCEEPCMAEFLELSFDGKPASLKGTHVQEGAVYGNWGYFPGKDPAVFWIPVPEGARNMHVCIRVCPTQPEAIQQAIRREEELLRLQEQMLRMEQTKVWKAYRRYRDFRERKHSDE